MINLLLDSEEELKIEGTLEHRKIFLAFVKVATQLDADKTTLNKVITRLDMLDSIIKGDSMEHPGIVNKLDRLIEENKSSAKFRWLILTSVIGTLVIKIGEIMLRH